MFDPFDAETIADPFPHYRRLRDEAPVHHNRELDLWFLSRYRDVRWALRTPEVFSSNQGVGSERRPVPMMIAMDAPEHTVLRRLVAREFTPRKFEQWTDRIAGRVDALLDTMLATGTCDLAETLAYPLPIWVIAEMMDVPVADRADFKRWSDDTVDALGGGLDAETSAKVEAGIAEFATYFDRIVTERRESLGDDLVSMLVNPAHGEPLSHFELVAFCILLLVAGNETTTNMIGNMFNLLLDHPDQLDLLRDDPTLASSAVEEVLRYDSSIQGFFRNTLDEVELHGVTIPADAKVMMLYGSANRDEREFPDPDRFDVTRNPETHLAFGSGPHLCLGAPLARLEGTVCLQRSLSRLGRIERAGPTVRTANPLLRGVRHLPVSVGP